MNETQIQTMNLTIQGKVSVLAIIIQNERYCPFMKSFLFLFHILLFKDTQIDELNKMVEELMKKNGIMDDDELSGEEYE
jgi:hypothetical protein